MPPKSTKDQEANSIAKNFEDWRKYINFVCAKSKFDIIEEALALAPASTARQYVSAHAGGLVEHSLRTMNYIMRLHATTEPLQKTKTTVEWNQTKNSLVKLSLLHDLGKAGLITDTGVTPYYMPTNERWRNERGFFYNINPELEGYTVADITLQNLDALAIMVSLPERDAINSINGRHVAHLDSPPETDNCLAILLQAAVKLSCMCGKHSTFTTEIFKDKEDTIKKVDV